MQGAAAVFLMMLGLGQLAATHWQWRGLSLVGGNKWVGYGTGAVLLVGGALMLPASFYVLLWTPLAGVLVVALQLWGGSVIIPPPHPDTLFLAEHPAHGGCRPVQIADGEYLMPGFLLYPPSGPSVAAVCIVPGAGDNKTFFKWRLIKTLLAEGLTVLSIDPHGHGDYRNRPLVYPDCLSAVSSAVAFLRQQPGVERVGLVGISLGGAMVINALINQDFTPVEAVVITETPVRLNFNRALVYRELWNTLYGSPVLALLKETTVKQIRASWRSGGYVSRHTTSELFNLLNPLENIKALKNVPMLLVYSRCDVIAPPEQAQAMRRAAPQAAFIEAKKASHMMLTLVPRLNVQVARWLNAQLIKQTADR